MRIQAPKFRTVRLLACAALVAMFGGAIAFQAPAQGYPPVACYVQLTPPSGHLVGGQSFKLVGSSTVTSHWTVKFNGVTHYYTGKSFTATYRTPKVATRTVLDLTITCSNVDGSKTIHFQIVLDPFSSGNGGHLPNTGGPDLWLLLTAIGLISVGGVMVATRQRRHPSRS